MGIKYSVQLSMLDVFWPRWCWCLFVLEELDSTSLEGITSFSLTCIGETHTHTRSRSIIIITGAHQVCLRLTLNHHIDENNDKEEVDFLISWSCCFYRNPALEDQACDRIYRVGQTKDVTIHRWKPVWYLMFLYELPTVLMNYLILLTCRISVHKLGCLWLQVWVWRHSGGENFHTAGKEERTGPECAVRNRKYLHQAIPGWPQNHFWCLRWEKTFQPTASCTDPF